MCHLLTIQEAPAYVREIAIDTGYRIPTQCYAVPSVLGGE